MLKIKSKSVVIIVKPIINEQYNTQLPTLMLFILLELASGISIIVIYLLGLCFL